MDALLAPLFSFQSQYPPKTGATKILIVDDEPVVRHVCQLSLEQELYSILIADNGIKAMELLRSEPDIAIVLSDFKMPGMTGFELLNAIKRDFPHIEVIIMTGFATIENAIEAMKSGAYDFLLKPLKAEQIRLVMNKCREKISLSQENLTLKRANEKLRELQIVKDKFLAITSHELRTPVSHLRGYLSILNGDDFHLLSPVEKKECMSVINAAVLDLEQIVTDMFDLIELEQGAIVLKREPFELNELLEQIEHEFRRPLQERQQTLTLRRCPQPCMIAADRLKIKIMVSELIQNAIKFTPDHGRIELALHIDGNFYVFVVADTGVGIKQEKMGTIFEKFYEVQHSNHHSTSKTGFMGGGMGLGLSLARAIAEAHDGGIKVSSEVGKGSVFQIFIPINQSL